MLPQIQNCMRGARPSSGKLDHERDGLVDRRPEFFIRHFRDTHAASRSLSLNSLSTLATPGIYGCEGESLSPAGAPSANHRA
jgi:hypothetical protein